MAGDDVGLVLEEAQEAMNKTILSFRKELQRVRTGRASTSLLDGVLVDYFDTPTQLNQLANLTTPDPRLIVISPYDKSAAAGIEKAIMASDLGLTPNNDGSVIRIAIPPLTEERRKQMVKKVRALSEEAKTAIRQIRRDSNDGIKALEKDSQLSEDDARRAMDAIQKTTDRHTAEVDELCKTKEQELMEI